MTQPPSSAADAARPSNKTVASALVACVGVACAAILSPFVSGWESGGKQHLTAYRDIGGVWTVCDGDTLKVTKGTVETKEGCVIRLDKRLADHAAPVLQCTPTLATHAYQMAAAISLAYNIGTGAYCASSVDRRFDARQWRAACDAFLMWDKVDGQPIAGLLNRRRAERALCLQELPA